MLLAAALVPDTALLVPGVSGSAQVLGTERSTALTALGSVLSAGPDRVVVVSGGPPGVPGQGGSQDAGAGTSGPVRASLAAAGVPDDCLGWAPAVLPRATRAAAEVAPPVTVHDVGASVSLHLLHRAGWSGPVTLVHATGEAATLRDLGRDVVTGPEAVVLVLAGSLSARRGPDGPLATDDRAAGFDDAVLTDLVDPGTDAVARLGEVPRGLAVELAVSAWSVWQVLLGAAGGRHLDGRLWSASAPFGATYVVVTWTAVEGS